MTNSPDIGQYAALVQAARENALDDALVAEVATTLARSGAMIDWPRGARTADLASTGGPGSLSTLLAPLYLVQRGLQVVKLGVPGRPAGGIDTLGTIPGYRVNLTPDEVHQVVQDCGYAHFVADRTFAPADAALFEFRKNTGNLAIPSLVVASILSKKLAVGVSTVGLEARVGPFGNFGSTRDTARENLRLFCRVAQLLGMRAVGFLVDASRPSIPGVGRGESLAALMSVLGDRAEGKVSAHARNCLIMAETVAQLEGNPTDSLCSSERAFAANIHAQGGTSSDVTGRLNALGNEPRYPIVAAASGQVQLDLGMLRDVFVAVQGAAKARDGCAFSDPIGLLLLKELGSTVQKGDLIAELRLGPGATVTSVLADVSACWQTTELSPKVPESLGMEIIYGA